MRILLIDDEPGVLRALELLLQAIGHQSKTFSNPAEAVDSLQLDADFDLVLCDLRMEPLNGFEVLKRIHSAHPALPLVLISAHATDKDVDHAKALGAIGFLAKPFQPIQFEQLVNSLAQ